MDYNIGDDVTYGTFGGFARRVTVTAKDELTGNNPAPGFDGTNSEGSFWGYDSQILIVHQNYAGRHREDARQNA